MNPESAPALPLSDEGTVTFVDLVQASGLAEDVLRELVACGALAPLDLQAVSWTFTARCVVTAREASRLQRDFDLDVHALSVVLGFAERVAALEAELRALHARLG